MHICLVAEGSYPYITGGVSSWINQLVENMPEHDFSVIAINPDSNKKGEYVYKLPANLNAVHDIFLDVIFSSKGRWNKKILLEKSEIDLLVNLIAGTSLKWNELFSCFCKLNNNHISAADLLQSKIFYDCVKKIYLRSLSQLSFAPVYWTMRSMYVVVFALLLCDFPKADLYHAVSTGYAGFIGARAAYTENKPFLLTEHGLYTREREEEIIMASWMDGRMKNLWIRYFSQLSYCTYDCASAVISLFSHNLELQKQLGCPAEKQSIIHNGIDSSKFESVAEKVRQRKSPDRLNIGAVIRVVPIKDIKTMIQAFAIVEKDLPSATFYIMGPIEEDQEYYQECLQYMSMINTKNIIFTGRVDIRQKLQDIDLLVLTSISEGQPLAILEGLACSIPFVSTAVGDCISLLNGCNDNYGPAGLIAPVMNASVLAEQILTLCRHHEIRRSMGENGLLRVKHYYSFASFINQYKKLYQDLSTSNESM